MSVPGPGSKPEFQQLYDEFQPRIRRYLSRFVGASEAEDLTQDVFLKASQALHRFRGDSRALTWLYRIATNAALDALRRPSFQRAVPTPERAAARSAVDVTPGLEQDLVRKEMNGCIRRYMETLPVAYRSVLILGEEEGLTNQEIAAALGVSLDTVKIRLHRARARLKRELAGGCDLYRDERNELACEPKREGVSSGD